jgi:hypothetical protein
MARPSRVVTAATLGTFVVVFAALQGVALTRTAATFDEPGGLLAGYAALARRDYRPAIEHPPLLRMWNALPLMLMSDVRWNSGPIDRSTPEEVAFPGPFAAGQRFLYADNDADRLLYPARAMTVVLALGLGVLLFFSARDWLGQRAATLALALYTVEPNLAAHGGLATNDLGVTFLMFASLVLLERLMTRWSLPRALAFVLVTAAAILGKFTALLLAPAAILIVASGRRRGSEVTWRRAGLLAFGCAAAIVSGAWVLYGFRYLPSDSTGWRFALDQMPLVRDAVPGLASVVGTVDAWHVLPNAFTQGFLHGQGLVQARPAFLAGDYSSTGWWYYFPVAFLLKTPLALIALALVGSAAAARGRVVAAGSRQVVVVASAIVVFGGIAMTSSLNIGLRHILPIYPFVIMLAALGCMAIFRRLGDRRGWQVVGVLLALCAAEYARAWPSTLAFFNVAAGGPAGGYRYLADSNVDWGQDLKPLKAWMDRNGVDHVNLAYFGVADPAYYGMSYTPIWGTTIPSLTPDRLGPPRLPGYVAASVTLLNGVPFGPAERQFYKPLRDREPAAVIGGSIRVFWVERPWW